ncbi:hypothetical protein D3P96_06500 [Weissella viridescens]|uniref:Uncharacterized protein n=1 Tax=Weissella viridescens TaxID=1629 RepID=A0A3P2RJI2_WEIVI|nr:hypothetical protein [Weissella viridescens]RRG17598.1 hypothetical protein D3P96_06500 [Weissella viridescens]
MSKKFKVIVSLAVAFLVVVGSVAVIGANSSHKDTMAQSSSSARPATKHSAPKEAIAKPAAKVATPAQAVTSETAQSTTTQVANDATQASQVTAQSTVAVSQKQTEPDVATQTAAPASTTASSQATAQPAVPFEKDAQGNASQAVVDYAQQNGIDLNGLQVGTSASESGSGYDVMIRDKKAAENGQGDGVLNEYHVDKNGVVTPK